MKVMVISILFCILLISGVYAMRINEVEVNPAGTDAGNEWAEFYNDGEISLEGYIIMNNDGENVSLNGSFDRYFVYTFAKQWLDNSNESIYLYKDLVLIDKTDLLADSNNNGLTWQFCEGDWKFLNSTKGQKNNCPAEEETSENNNGIENDSSEGTDSKNQEENLSQNPKQTSPDFIPAEETESQIPSQNQIEPLVEDKNQERIILTPKKEEIFISKTNPLKDIKSTEKKNKDDIKIDSLFSSMAEAMGQFIVK